MKLFYGKPKSRGGRFCASINGQSQDFSSGINRKVSIKREFRNARVVCAHRPERDMPDVYVHRHNRRVYNAPLQKPGPPPKHHTRTVIHKHYYGVQKPNAEDILTPAPVSRGKQGR